MICNQFAEHYYKSLPGYFDFEQVYLDAIEWIPDGGTFVEVGCWQGQSLAFLLVEAHNSGKQIKVFGCDHFLGSAGDGPLLHEAELKSIAAHCMNNLRRASYPYALIKADSVTASTFFADESIDYCFIDAGHHYEEVKADLEAWLPKMKPTGIMAGHDYNQAPVSKAVDESFCDRYVTHIEMDRCYYPNGYTWGTCWRVRLQEPEVLGVIM